MPVDGGRFEDYARWVRDRGIANGGCVSMRHPSISDLAAYVQSGSVTWRNDEVGRNAQSRREVAMRRVVVGSLALVLVLAGCTTESNPAASVGCDNAPVAPGDYEGLNDVDGAGQKCWTIVPPTQQGDPIPLHMLLASAGGHADQNYAAWRPFIDDSDGLVVIVGTDPDTDSSVDTFEVLVDQLGKDYCIDLDRVHVSGGSWSSALAAVLMCEMPDTFASFADSLGGFVIDLVCEPIPKPLLAITGDPDHSQVARSVEYWADINQCDPDPTVADLGSGIIRYTYGSCEADVVFYHFEGMGHQIPVNTCVGPAMAAGVCAEYPTFDSFDAWTEFFAEHPLE